MFLGKHVDIKTYNQAQKIVEYRNRLRNNPGNDPNHKANSDPGANGEEAVAVHLVRSAEDAHIDLFASNMSQHNSGKDSLLMLACKTRVWEI